MLLDENLPRRLKRHLRSEVEALTVQDRGWSGRKNGDLLRAAAVEFDCIITTDRGIEHQQNLRGLDLGVILLSARSNRMVDLLPLVADLNEAIEAVKPGELLRVTSQV